MDGIQIDNVLLPQDLIIDDGRLKGYTMKYFENSIPLSDKFLERYFNCNDLLTCVEKASRILRNIHKNGIVYQDLSFQNILVDKRAPIQNIPYLDEVIDLTDDYEIDRKKVLTTKQRILGKFRMF